MSPKKLVSILITISIFSSFLIIFQINSTKADEIKEDITVMFTSDWQNYGTPHADINANCDIDLLFNIGDLVNDPTKQSEWDTFHSNWDATVGTGTIIHRNYVQGNHESLFWACISGTGCYEDCWWPGRSRLTPESDLTGQALIDYCNSSRLGPNWTYTYGNVIFIGVPLAYRSDFAVPGKSNVYGWDTPWFNWFNQTVQDNQDKNIIVLSHLSIHTGTQNYYYGLVEQDDIYWVLENYNVLAWIYGHNHAEPSCVLNRGTYHIHASIASKDSRKSVLFDFTNGSDTVGLRVRNHGSSSWTNSISGYSTLPLDYTFDPTYDSEEEPGFQSINDLTNNTVTYEPISRFNWSKYDGAVYYQLQIANDSGFTDVFVNLTNINATNYPGNYSEFGVYVEFILPVEQRESWYQDYYMRVRPWYYYDG